MWKVGVRKWRESKEGRGKNGLYTQLSGPNKNDLTFMAMIADLTNSIAPDEIKIELDTCMKLNDQK